MRTLLLNFDGSISRPNPGGTCAYGFTVSENKEIIAQGSELIGTGMQYSNNYAEFFGLYKGLEKVTDILKSSVDKYQVFVLGDSQLVINIMNKKFRTSEEKLYYPAYLKADELTRSIRKSGILVTFDWIPREMNEKADELSKYQNFTAA